MRLRGWQVDVLWAAGAGGATLATGLAMGGRPDAAGPPAM